MKRMTLALAMAGTLFGSTHLAASPLTTEEQKVSYSLGLMFGENLQADFPELDTDAFRRGLETVYGRHDALMTADEVEQTMRAFQQKRMEEQLAAFGAQAESNLERGNAYRAENAKKRGVVTTESGLQIEELRAGSGATPKATDTVKVHYRGQLTDGTVFDSSYERGQPVSFPLEGVIPGWTEGLQKIKQGGKARLVIPPELAYGSSGMGNAIGPNETLIFEVELLEINPDLQR